MADALTVPAFPRVEDYAGVWAIEPAAGAALFDLARRADLPAHVAAAVPPRTAAADGFLPVRAGNGETVAVVTLTGTLMKSAGSMSAGTSTVMARKAIRQAANDPEVSAILLAVDSPGGTVAGTADLAAEVKAAAKKKPVWAQVEDLGASAAYWAASQADKVFANTPTALVGSIGALSVLYDLSAAAESQGIKTLVIGTGPLKGAGAPGAPITEDQQAYFRGLVENAQESFDAAVRSARSLTERQLEAVKSGGVFGAAEAQARKLIDGVQSMDATLSQLAAEARRRTRSSPSRAAVGPTPVRSAAMDETTVTAGADSVAAPIQAADPVAEFRRQMAAETARIGGVQRAAAGHADIAATAVAEGWSVEKTELHVLRAERAAGPAVNPHHAGPRFVFGVGKYQPGAATVANGVKVEDAMAVAILHSLGRTDTPQQYSAEARQAADDNFRGFGLQQFLLTAAAHNGYPVGVGEKISKGNLARVLRSAFGDADPRTASGGQSTFSMSGILGAVANKEILAGYTEDDMAWKEISQVKNVSNFQTYTSYRMLDDMEYEQLPPGGEIKHGTVAQESITRSAKTYAKMFLLDRTSIINDDLGAFDDLRTRLGRGANKKFNKVFWTAFVNNSSFFTSGLTNYISGSTTNLGTDGVGLGLGVKGFRQMTSPSTDGTKHVGAPGGRPEILLVPPSLEANAEILYRNANLGAVASSSANIYANKYRPVVAWQLEDSSYTGYSATAWYLFGSPRVLAPMFVSFLDGQMAPTVEMTDADFNTLGVQFRGYHDFGCDKAEYLSGIKSKGAA